MENKQPHEVSSLVYTVPEIAVMLHMNLRTAYALCHNAPAFKVIRYGRNVRVNKESFDRWFKNEGSEG